MEREMMARCGTYCGVCAWKDRIHCLGCQGQKGEMFFGPCDKALKCPAKSCGICSATRTTATRVPGCAICGTGPQALMFTKNCVSG